MAPEIRDYDPLITEQYMKLIYGIEDLTQLSAAESCLNLEPWQSNQRCLRSLFNLGVKKPNAREEKKRKQTRNLAKMVGNRGKEEGNVGKEGAVVKKEKKKCREARVTSNSLLTKINAIKNTDSKVYAAKIKETLRIFD